MDFLFGKNVFHFAYFTSCETPQLKYSGIYTQNSSYISWVDRQHNVTQNKGLTCRQINLPG